MKLNIGEGVWRMVVEMLVSLILIAHPAGYLPIHTWCETRTPLILGSQECLGTGSVLQLCLQELWKRRLAYYTSQSGDISGVKCLSTVQWYTWYTEL